MTNVPTIKRPYRDPLLIDLFNFYVEADLINTSDYAAFLENAKKYTSKIKEDVKHSLRYKSITLSADMFDCQDQSRSNIFKLLISFDSFCKAVYDVIMEQQCQPTLTTRLRARTSKEKAFAF